MPQSKVNEIKRLQKELRGAVGPADRAELSLKLAETIGNSSLKEAFAAAEQAVKFAAGGELSDLECRSRIRCGSLLWTMGRMTEAEQHYRVAMTLATTLASEEYRGATLQGLAHVHVHRGDYATAKQFAESALEVARKRDDLVLMRKSLISLSIIYSNTSDYVKSLAVAQEAVEVALKVKDSSGEAFCRAALAHVYSGLGDIDSAMEQQVLAVKAADDSGAPGAIGSACMTLGSSYLEKKDYVKAEECFRKAQRSNPKMKPRDRAVLTLNMGALLFAKGKQEKALELLQKGLVICEEIQNRRLIAIARKDIAIVYQAAGKRKKALKEFELAMSIAQLLEDRGLECEVLEHSIGLYDALGMLREALDASQRLLTIKSQVMLDEQQRKAMRMEAEMQLERARKEKELAEMRASVLELRTTSLEEEVTHKQRELTKIALELAEKNEIIHSIKEEYSAQQTRNSPSSTSDTKRIRDMLDRFETSAAEQWSQFEVEFEKLNKVLYQRLSQQAPKLTPTELKVCALLRVGLNSKEIGKLLFVSHLVVYNYRFHIREKLRLQEGTHLTTYLQSLGGI